MHTRKPGQKTVLGMFLLPGDRLSVCGFRCTVQNVPETDGHIRVEWKDQPPHPFEGDVLVGGLHARIGIAEW